jgi:ketosteroid isomerase-like protein
MPTMEKAADYVERWVAAFESKDLDDVLAFYTNDVILRSPLVARPSHDPRGTVQGKAALRAYVKKGFEVFDHIEFTVLDVLRGSTPSEVVAAGSTTCRGSALLRRSLVPCEPFLPRARDRLSSSA